MKVSGWLAAVMLLIGPVTAHAQEASDILKRTADLYRGLDTYRFDADVSMSMLSGPQQQAMDVSLLMAARRPDDLHVELVAPNVEITIITDGDSTWMYMPPLNQYMATAGGFDPDDPGSNVPDLLGEYQRIDERVRQAALLREEAVEVDGQSHPAYVLSVEYEPRETPAGVDSTRKTLWIDKERHLVLRDDTRAKMSASPFGGPMVVEETTLFSRLTVGQPLPDSLFVFTPPQGATRVYPEDMMEKTEAGPSGLSGQPASDFVLKNLKGEAVSLQSLRGKVVLINFWATWCGPCRFEMPAIQRIYDEFNDDGLEVLAISLGEAAADVAAYVKEYGYTFPVLVDPSAEVGTAYGTFSIPTSVIVGPDGMIVHHLIGAHSEEGFRSALKEAGIE